MADKDGLALACRAGHMSAGLTIARINLEVLLQHYRSQMSESVYDDLVKTINQIKKVQDETEIES